MVQIFFAIKFVLLVLSLSFLQFKLRFRELNAGLFIYCACPSNCDPTRFYNFFCGRHFLNAFIADELTVFINMLKGVLFFIN
jgi:hypothetical protein